MNPTEQAARWLADVTRWTKINGQEIVGSPLLDEAQALAAIARHLAPGDDLVERAEATLEGVTKGPWKAAYSKWEPNNFIVQTDHPCRRVLAQFDGDGDGPDDQSLADARFIAFAREWVPEAAARIAALTATVGEAREQRSDAEARMETAERENARLRDRLARMEGDTDPADAFNKADWFWCTMDPDDCGDSPEEAINRAMVGRFCVCEIASSYAGPTRYGFIAPVLDPDSDDEEFVHFATQQEAIGAAKARAALETPADGGKHE